MQGSINQIFASTALFYLDLRYSTFNTVVSVEVNISIYCLKIYVYVAVLTKPLVFTS